MPRWPLLAQLPAGVRVEEGRRGVLAVREDYAEALAERGFGPDGGEPPSDSDLAGRRPLGEFQLGGERLVVRRFRHGGLLRWVTRERFGDPRRPFRELILSARLEDLGLRTPRVVAARALRASGGGWRLDLLTRRVEGALDFAEWLEALREGRVPPVRRFAALRAVGDFLGRMHARGLWHADLNPRNLLLEAPDGAGGFEPPRVWILDLDRSVLGPALEDGQRWSNLARLLRAVVRREERGRRFLTRGDHGHLLAAYRRALSEELGVSGDWRDDWRGVRATHGRRSAAHRAFWRLEEALGGGAETRDGGARVRRTN